MSRPFYKGWGRELRIFLIHYGIWVTFGLVTGWLEFQYLSADMIHKASPTMEKYKDDWNGYVLMNCIGDLLYLLPMHASYWLFILAQRTGKVWAMIMFGLYFFAYVIIVAFTTGIVVGYFDLKVKRQEELMTVVFLWLYALLFIIIRAYRQNRRKQRDLELQKTKAELQNLKAQVNPHFMFNTLNNLYGTALSGDSDRTAAGIEQLSSVMRHVTEASRQDFIPIEQEIRFVEDIVELHRMRVPKTDMIQIKTEIDWDEQPAQIAPLLLNPLIENAFKYGISVQYPCFIHIQLHVKEEILHFVIKNSLLPRTSLEKGTGLGLSNVRQRLTLAYPGQHSLQIHEENNVFSVDLMIKLHSKIPYRSS